MTTKIEGWMTLTPDMDFSRSPSWAAENKLVMDAKVEGGFGGPRQAAVFRVGFDKRVINLARVKGPCFSVQIGPVPIPVCLTST